MNIQMMRIHARYEVLLSITILALFIGCGTSKNPPPKLAPASGTVTRDGKPLAGVAVGFYPDLDKGTQGPASFGTTDAEGYFELYCNDGKKGAVIGKHKITVVCPQLSSSAPPPPKSAVPCEIPAAYGIADTTKLTAEVTTDTTPLIIDIPTD